MTAEAARLALLAPLVALQWALFAAILLAFLLGRRIIEVRMRIASELLLLCAHIVCICEVLAHIVCIALRALRRLCSRRRAPRRSCARSRVCRRG